MIRVIVTRKINNAGFMSKNQDTYKIHPGENTVCESNSDFCIKQWIKLPRIHPQMLRVSLPPVQNFKMNKLKKFSTTCDSK